MTPFANRWIPQDGQRVIVKRTKCYRTGLRIIEQPGSILGRIGANTWQVQLDCGTVRAFAKQCLEWQPTPEEIAFRAQTVRSRRRKQ